MIKEILLVLTFIFSLLGLYLQPFFKQELKIIISGSLIILSASFLFLYLIVRKKEKLNGNAAELDKLMIQMMERYKNEESIEKIRMIQNEIFFQKLTQSSELLFEISKCLGAFNSIPERIDEKFTNISSKVEESMGKINAASNCIVQTMIEEFIPNTQKEMNELTNNIKNTNEELILSLDSKYNNIIENQKSANTELITEMKNFVNVITSSSEDDIQTLKELIK